ncbi:MAG TPA: hypothetical protein VFW06_05935 [Acidimicrobiia bacterium]|nr:hypothetical protein [Acidimicrobiia bacterium]
MDQLLFVSQFRDPRPDARVLLRVPDGALDPDVAGASMSRIGHPLAWWFAEDEDRVSSTSLGHFPHAWESPDCLRHLAGALGEGD